MRLRTIRETPPKPTDQVFRQSRLMWLSGFLVGLLFVAGGVAIIAGSGDLFGWCFFSIAMVVALPFGYLFASTLHSENWILRYNPPKLLIKIRCHSNLHLSDDDPVIVELDTSEIAWIRKVRAQVSTLESPIFFLELKLKSQDLAELKSSFDAEAQRGRKSFRFAHDPVWLTSGGIIRIEWRGGGWIVPNVDAALALLGSSVPVIEGDQPATAASHAADSAAEPKRWSGEM